MAKHSKKSHKRVSPFSSSENRSDFNRPNVSRRALVVFAVMATCVVVISAMATWRSSPAGITPMQTSSPPSLPANMPSKEYVYSGSSLISTVEPFLDTPSDLAVWRPSSGVWYIVNGQSQVIAQQFGAQGDKLAPGDFDGDGKTDFCVFRPSDTTWYMVRSSDASSQISVFGTSEDIPTVADFDGDGKSDIAVWRPSNQTWYIQNSSSGSISSAVFGSSGDQPVPADFDGDGKADLSIWRNSGAIFYVYQSGNGVTVSASIGASGDEPVVGDYDGDGKADFATRRTSDTYWRIRNSSDPSGAIISISWGLSTDVSVPARYNDAADNDVKTDIAVWRPSTGIWYIRRSTDASMRIHQLGMQGDIPMPSNWRR